MYGSTWFGLGRLRRIFDCCTIMYVTFVPPCTFLIVWRAVRIDVGRLAVICSELVPLVVMM